MISISTDHAITRKYRAICERVQSIDIRCWSREARHKRNQSFSYSWPLDGKPCGAIQVRTGPTAVVLGFVARALDHDEWHPVEQRVPIVWTSCHLGGLRPWFCCMAVTGGKRCDRRAAILYLGASLIFAYRHCYGLSYASQSERLGCRGLGRARKIRMKLGGGPNLLEAFPPRPKRMHRRTCERLRAAYAVAAFRCGILDPI